MFGMQMIASPAEGSPLNIRVSLSKDSSKLRTVSALHLSLESCLLTCLMILQMQMLFGKVGAYVAPVAHADEGNR